MIDSLFKPNIILPSNFIRTAFQAGTAYYRQDNRKLSPLSPMVLASRVIFNIHSWEASGLTVAEEDELSAGYFHNEAGGTALYVHYNNPSFFNVERKSSLMLLGNISQLPERGQLPQLEAHFLFVGHHVPNGMEIDTVKLTSDNPSGWSTHTRYDPAESAAMAHAFYYADQCFMAVLTGAPVNPQTAKARTESASQADITTRFEQIKTRSLGELERQVQIVSNVPLNTYATGPVI